MLAFLALHRCGFVECLRSYPTEMRGTHRRRCLHTDHADGRMHPFSYSLMISAFVIRGTRVGQGVFGAFCGSFYGDNDPQHREAICLACATHSAQKTFVRR